MKEQLQALRKSKKLTQEDIANIIGVKLSTYQKYERDVIAPSYDTLIKIADFYGVTTDYLLGRDTTQLVEDVSKMSDNELDKKLMQFFMDLPENSKQGIRDFVLSIAHGLNEQLPISKQQEESQQQAPEIIQTKPQSPPQPVEPSCLPLPVEQPVVIQKLIQIEASEQNPWQMAARSADGKYTTRTLTPEEVELIDSLEDVPKSRY